METNTTYFKATLCVTGTAPRCRKVEFHTDNLKTLPIEHNEAQLNDLKAEATKTLAKYKNVRRAYITLNYTIYDGTFESIEMMGTKNKNISLEIAQ